jgi:DNA polymerase III delta prime subunit
MLIFVLATTDPQRVLPTIISRCQRFDYRRIPLEADAEPICAIHCLPRKRLILTTKPCGWWPK